MTHIGSGNRPGERIALTLSAGLKAQVRARAQATGTTMSDWVLEAVKQRLTPEQVDARRLVMVLAALLEEYSRPNAVSLASRTPTVIETLADAKAWLGES